VFRGADDRLYWKRRVSLSDLLAFEQRLLQETLDITARDISSWLAGQAATRSGRSSSRTMEVTIYTVDSTEQEVYCYVDCSDIAIGVTLANEQGDVFFDFTALRAPDKGSIRTSTHINCGELESCIKGVELLIKLGYTKATLCCDSTAATHWLQSLVDKQRIQVNGLYKLLVTRRLDILRSLLDHFRLQLKIIQVRSQNNLADIVTRVDFNIDPFCEEDDAYKLVACVPKLGGEEQAWWP
ncbi:hypothetical protein FOL47_004266, partial [Perkinsus chesapeaki]